MLFGQGLWFVITTINLPYHIPEFSQLPLIFRIESELGLRINDDSRVESSATKHHRRFDVGVSVKDSL